MWIGAGGGFNSVRSQLLLQLRLPHPTEGPVIPTAVTSMGLRVRASRKPKEPKEFLRVLFTQDGMLGRAGHFPPCIQYVYLYWVGGHFLSDLGSFSI